jgi:transposase
MIPLAAVAPAFFPPEVRAQATSLACQLPAESEIPLARWTYAELAARLVALGIVVGIANSTIWRWFQAERIKPWRYRMWMKVRDPHFLERATVVLQLYEQAQTLIEHGIWVLCVDEKTSIQAREGEDPPEPPQPGHPMRCAPRYYRRGVLNLFASLSVADGMVAGISRARKTFADFQAFFTEIIVPEATRRGVKTIRMIMDNGPTHAPKQIEGWLATTCESLPFTAEVVWLPTYASWLDQIEIWFSVLQRKLLTPSHFSSIEQLEQSLLRFIEHYNQTAKPLEWSYTVKKLVEKFGKDL